MNRRALALALGGALALGAAGAAGGDDSPWNGWSSLRLKTRKMLFFTGSVEMSVRRDGAADVLETTTHAKFMGATMTRSHTVSRIDRASGRPLELTTRSAKRGRHYVFGEQGYTVRKLSPIHGPDAPLARWDVTSEAFFAYPEADGRRPPLHDYYGMLLRIGTAGLDRPGDEAVFWVATSRGPRSYNIRVTERRVATRTFHDARNGEKRRAAVSEVRLRIAPGDPDDDDEGFLRMEGETELWVESESGTLLEINGRIPRVPGRVEIEIDSIG